MSNNRDDFTKKTIDRMAKRVGYRCSNPHCRKLTCGAAQEPDDYVNIGVAAHICAAAPGGKRYDRSMTTDQRKSILNGIWLCQTCAKLVDSDEKRYTVDVLHKWKYDAETEAAGQLESTNNASAVVREKPDVLLLNQEISNLLTMMEMIHQKLDAAKQDENVFMEQAYEKRLDSLMLLYTTLDAQLREIVSDSGMKNSVTSNTMLDQKANEKRSSGMAWVMPVGAMTAALGIANTNVFGALALLAGSVMLGWGIGTVFHDGPRLNDINAKIEIDPEKVLNHMQVMRAMIGQLEHEVGKLHMDRIAYERELVESNETACCVK